MMKAACLALLLAGAHAEHAAPQSERLLEASWILATVDSSLYVDSHHAAEVARALRAIRAANPALATVRQNGLDLKVAVWVKPDSFPWIASVPTGIGNDTIVRTLGVPSLDRLGRELGVLDYRVSNFDADGIVVTPRFPRTPAFIGMAARYRADPAVERVTANHDILGGATAIFVSRTDRDLVLTLWDGSRKSVDGTADIVSYRFAYDRRTRAIRRLES